MFVCVRVFLWWFFFLFMKILLYCCHECVMRCEFSSESWICCCGFCCLKCEIIFVYSLSIYVCRPVSKFGTSTLTNHPQTSWLLFSSKPVIAILHVLFSKVPEMYIENVIGCAEMMMHEKHNKWDGTKRIDYLVCGNLNAGQFVSSRTAVMGHRCAQLETLTYVSTCEPFAIRLNRSKLPALSNSPQ